MPHRSLQQGLQRSCRALDVLVEGPIRATRGDALQVDHEVGDGRMSSQRDEALHFARRAAGAVHLVAERARHRPHPRVGVTPMSVRKSGAGG